MVIIKSGCSLFGGFTRKSWRHSGQFENDGAAFIFSLTNVHDMPPAKSSPKFKGVLSIGAHKNAGPIFTFEDDNIDDLYVNGTYLVFPGNFEDAAGSNYILFEKDDVTLDDVEVYSLIT